MTDQKGNIISGGSKSVFDDNNPRPKPWFCLGKPCSRPLIAFLSQLFVPFGEFISQILGTNQLLGWFFHFVQQYTFYPHEDYEKTNFYKNLRLHINDRSLRQWKVTTIFTTGSKLEAFNQNSRIRWTTISLNWRCFARKDWKSQFWSKFELWIDVLVKKGTKYLLIFDNSCEGIYNSKAFVDIATAWRHGELSIFTISTAWYIKANLGEKLCTKILTFSSNLPVIYCKSLRLVNNWRWDQS